MAHDEDDDEELRFPPLFEKTYGLLKSSRYVIIAVWVAALIWGAFTGGDYIKGTEDTASAPRGTRTEADYKVFQTYFPEFANEKMLIMYMECASKDCRLVCPSTNCARGCHGQDSRITQAIDGMAKEILQMKGITSYQSYFNFSNTVLDSAKCTFASQDGHATFATFTFANEATNPEKHAVINTILRELVPKYNPAPEEFRMSLTGFDALAKDGSEDAITEVIRIDIFTMPVAFALLGYMVRSWRLLLLAGMNTGITMAFSFAFLAEMSKLTGKKPLSTSSSLVEVLGLAMAIDYSLFLLRRFRDELKNKRTVEVAIKLSLFNAGHVVLLSSLTFSCVFLGFLALPSVDLQTIAQASIVAVLTALVVCMTNTASMLLVFPTFFSGEMVLCARDGEATKKQEYQEVQGERIAADLYDALMLGDAVPSAISSHGPINVDSTSLLNDLPLVPPPPSSISGTPPLMGLGRTVTGKRRHRRGAKYTGCYFTFLKVITTFPYNLIFVVVVYSLSIPIALRVLDLKHNQDVSQAITRSAPSSKAFQNMSAAFPGGTLSPFYVILEADHSVLDKDHGPALFKAIHTFVSAVVHETNVQSKLVVSPATLQGKSIDYSTASRLLDANSIFCRNLQKEACALYTYLYHKFTSADGRAVLMTFTIDENPYGEAGRSFIEGCLRVIDRKIIDTDKYCLHLSGDEVLMNADQDVAFNALPVLLSTTIIIIFLLLGCGFQSIMTPIRLSLTVFLPLTTVFGLAVMVYQDGLLDFTGFEALKKAELGFFWYIPIVCLLQALGLTVDYDVFSFSRIAEHRADGYEIRAAIIKAIWEVSSTICAAGLIMASVFSGLLLGASTAVNQFGFLLCTSVLVDTFIVQSLLVPAIISIGDRFAWYPRRMPQTGLITLDDPEFMS